LPKITASGTRLSIEGIKGNFDFKNFNEIDNGKSTFKFNAKKSSAQNLKALIAYFKTGNYQISRWSWLEPEANARPTAALLPMIGAGAAYLTSVNMLGAAVMVALGPIELTATLVTGTVLLIAAGFYALGNELYAVAARTGADASLECVDGRLRVKVNFGDGVAPTYHADDASEAADFYFSKVEKTVGAKICRDGGVMVELNKLLKIHSFLHHRSSRHDVDGADSVR
jgi:hypothetical protein